MVCTPESFYSTSQMLSFCKPVMCLVTVPPEQPVIEGYTNGSEVRVPHEQESLALTCISNNGKPAASIKWFRETVEITEGVVASSETLDSKLENSKSVLTFKPHQDDNQAYYRCEASNGALVKPLATSVQLSVLREYSVTRLSA